MNILIDIAHPAHVHLIKNVYKVLCKKGHNVVVTVKDIPVALRLLRYYEIPYIYLGGKSDSIIGKALLQLKYNLKLWFIVRKYKIDIGFGSSLTIAQLSKYTRIKSIILDDDDDEVEPLFVKFAHSISDVILSPDVIARKSLATIGYSGYHELAYLHPNYFEPDSTVLDDLEIKQGDFFSILRFNAFKAHHDVGVEGLSIENKRKIISVLEKKGRVFITTEREIDEEFRKYQLKMEPEKIHSLLYYATIFVGDSQTMTSESALLGTPAVKCNTFAGKLSVPNDIEDSYQLCFSFLPDQTELMFSKLTEILNTVDLKEVFQQRRQQMLADKIDVTAFFTWFIENYPESAKIMHSNPDYQYRFK